MRKITQQPEFIPNLICDSMISHISLRMSFALMFYLFFITVGSVFGQEVVQVVQPETRVVIKMPNGTHISTSLNQLTFLGYQNRPNAMQVLRNPRILESVDLSKAQQDVLREIRKAVADKEKDIAANCRTLMEKAKTTKEKLAIVKDHFQELNDFQARMETRINEELIPHQSDLVGRYRFQQLVERWGLGKAVLSDEFKKKLKILKSQNEEIEKINQTMQERVRKEIAKIKKEASNEIRKVLDKSQNEQVKKLEEPFRNKRSR